MMAADPALRNQGDKVLKNYKKQIDDQKKRKQEDFSTTHLEDSDEDDIYNIPVNENSDPDILLQIFDSTTIKLNNK